MRVQVKPPRSVTQLSTSPMYRSLIFSGGQLSVVPWYRSQVVGHSLIQNDCWCICLSFRLRVGVNSEVYSSVVVGCRCHYTGTPSIRHGSKDCVSLTFYYVNDKIRRLNNLSLLINYVNYKLNEIFILQNIYSDLCISKRSINRRCTQTVNCTEIGPPLRQYPVMFPHRLWNLFLLCSSFSLIPRLKSESLLTGTGNSLGR